MEVLGVKQVGAYIFKVNGRELKVIYPKYKPDGEVIYANKIYPLERVLDNGYILWTGQTSRGWVEIGIEFEDITDELEEPPYLYVNLTEKKNGKIYFPMHQVAGRRLPDVMKEAFETYEEVNKISPDDIEDLLFDDEDES